MAKIRELYEKLVAFRQKHGPHAFAKHYRQPEQIERLARESTAIDRPRARRRLILESVEDLEVVIDHLRMTGYLPDDE